MGYFDSIVLIKDGETYTSSDAVLQIFREMPGLWPWLYGLRIFPLGFRNAVYNWIANHRYGWFGKSDVKMRGSTPYCVGNCLTRVSERWAELQV